MTYMAVEAVTSSLVVTGIVHADPHEGNLMLADDGRLVFLDFGLMSRVSPKTIQPFALASPLTHPTLKPQPQRNPFTPNLPPGPRCALSDQASML